MTAAQASAPPSGSPPTMPAGRNRPSTVVVRAIDTALATSVASVTANTATNLPATMSNAEQGAISSVSIVPRSFSPAIASMAG